MNTHDDAAGPLEETHVVTAATEERLQVSTQDDITGTVRVRTILHRDVREVPVLLRSSAVQIERVQLNRFVEEEFAPRQDGDTFVVPVFEYVPVTRLQLVLKEELRIKTIVTTAADVQVVEIQRQEVVVERRMGATGEWIADAAISSSGPKRPDPEPTQ